MLLRARVSALVNARVSARLHARESAAVVVQFVGNPCNSFRIHAVRCESSQVCVRVCLKACNSE